VKIAKETYEQLKGEVAGVQLGAPMGRIDKRAPRGAKPARKKPKGGERRGRGTMEVGPAGVTLQFDPQSIPRARKAGAKKADDPVLLDASAAIRLLDPADELRRLLEGATLVSDRAETFEGKPVRTVVFRPVPDLDDEDRKAVKKFEETVTLRLDGGGLPVSLDRSTELKISKLLISFSVTRKESKWFSLAPGRLVTARSVEESHGSGLGQDSASRMVTTVTVL